MSKSRADPALLAALAAGSTLTAAAATAGVCERMARRRAKDPAFLQALDEARAAVVDRAVDHLAEAAVDAARVLRTVARSSPDERARVLACSELLALGRRGREERSLRRQVETLRRRIEEMARGSRPAAEVGGDGHA